MTKYLHSQKYLHFSVVNTPYQVRNHSSCCLRKWLYRFRFSTPVVFHNCFWYRSHPHHSPIGIKALWEIIPQPLTSLASQKTIGSIPASNRYFTNYTALQPKPRGSPYGQIRRYCPFSLIPLPAKTQIKGGTTSNQVSWIVYQTRSRFLVPPYLCLIQTFFSCRRVPAPLWCNNTPWQAYCSMPSSPGLHCSFAISYMKMRCLHIRPREILIPVLPVPFPLILPIRYLLCRYTPAIGRILPHLTKPLYIPRL